MPERQPHTRYKSWGPKLNGGFRQPYVEDHLLFRELRGGARIVMPEKRVGRVDLMNICRPSFESFSAYLSIIVEICAIESLSSSCESSQAKTLT